MLFLDQGSTLHVAREGFLSKYAALLDIIFRIGDVIIVATAALLAARLRFGHWSISGEYLTSTVWVSLLAIILFPAFNLYRSWRSECLSPSHHGIRQTV
jgi:hypothetical protein